MSRRVRPLPGPAAVGLLVDGIWKPP